MDEEPSGGTEQLAGDGSSEPIDELYLKEPKMEPMMPALEVEVPIGLTAGDILGVEGPDGTVYNVMVPDGLGPGDTLLIDLPGSGAGARPSPPPTQRDAAISAPTGAGKTLAFAVPLLCEAADELARRGTVVIDALAEEFGEDVPPAVMVDALAPKLQLTGAKVAGAARSSKMPAYTLPARGPPVGLVITPTASLAEQAARLLFSLVGRKDAREPLATKAAAMDTAPNNGRSITYDGPTAVRVVTLLTEEEGAAAAAAAADGTGPLLESDLLVASAAAVKAASGAIDTAALRMVCIDEADACDLSTLGALPESVSRVLIGATVSTAVAAAIESGWIESPMLMDGAGAARKWTEDDLAQALCPPGLTHRFSVAPESGDENAVQLQLLALARLLRKDLREWEELGAAAVQAPNAAFSKARGLASDVEPPPPTAADEAPTRPRAVVFTKTAEEALRVGGALRDALWGEQAVVARAGAAAEAGAAAFKSKSGNKGKGDFESVLAAGGASVLVVPMSEGRGLDFPDVTHVYCYALGLTPDQANEYAHMAGRSGRVGQSGRGVVTSVIASDADWVGVLNGLNAIVKGTLGRDLEAVAVPSTADDRDKRKALDDLVLLTKEEEPNASSS